ncbi:very low-density lipoprotein receptor-like [Littorina saxatilis]|uniref:very low-density lipoprotein receptor-like n=1 Tax=Littorina saxatilis TaxID=31220 RepID=UPI0038B5645A
MWFAVLYRPCILALLVSCTMVQGYDKCHNDTCGAHGTCNDTSGHVMCECEEGWTGTNCTDELQKCPGNKWQCGSNECVWKNERCNGRLDCADRSDEHNCANFTCWPKFWKCSNNHCIREDYRCDGSTDCRDGSDEQNCEEWTCPSEKWKCGTNLCTTITQRCDGNTNCDDGSDEKNCEEWTCPSDMWKCKTNLCIFNEQRCDGYFDNCADGSDEQNCGIYLFVFSSTCDVLGGSTEGRSGGLLSEETLTQSGSAT